MTTWGAIALARRNLARNRRSAALSVAGVATGVACLVFFMALGNGISSTVRTKLFPIDEATLEVVPPKLSLNSLLGSVRLDDAAIERLRAIPGVAAALPKMTVRVSAVSRYDGDFFGRPLHMGLEIMAVGVDPALVAKDIPSPERFADPGPGKPIPVVISTRLLEIYNRAFAEQRGLPKLSADLLNGFRFPIEFGRSFITAGDGHSEPGEVEVVGFSERALLGGVTIPLATARRLNHDHGDDTSYSSVVLRANSPRDVPNISAAAQAIGFSIDDSDKRLAEQVGFGIGLVVDALALLSVLITFMAAVDIAHAFYAAMRERRREIAILRAIGATRSDVLSVLLFEAASVGLGGALAGIVVALVAIPLVDGTALRNLPDFPFKPETFFQVSPLLVLDALMVGLLAALPGAFWPALSAARSDPAAALLE